MPTPKEVDGLTGLIGERVTFFCMNYIYTGKLVEVVDKVIHLTDASIVYETGPLGDGIWKTSESLPNDLYLMVSAVESFMVLK